MIDQKYAEARLRVFIEQLSEDEKQLDEEALFRRAQDALRNDRRFRLAAARAVFRRLVATHGNSFGVNPPF